jgi:hypothetical protein
LEEQLRRSVLSAVCISVLLIGGLIATGSPGLARTPGSGSSYSPAPKGELTYTKSIAEIMSSHCVSCHRAGEIGPFPLDSYDAVKKRTKQIEQLTASKQMPPWKADSHGEFLDENRLSVQEIGSIKQWADEGAIRGAGEVPAPIAAAPDRWKLGHPDIVLMPTQPCTISAEGRDEYHTFLLPSSFIEDKYISAVEVHPGNRAIVHHTVIYADTSGRVRKMVSAAGGMDVPRPAGLGLPKDGILDIWAPGNESRRLPDGVGLLLPKGADIVMEVHYHRSGKTETDQTKIGLYFCKGPVKQQMHLHAITQFGLFIPAGEAHYKTGAQLTSPADATVLNVFPHMHLIGKSMKVIMTAPSGEVTTLIDVPAWDFNWQNTYWYKNPVHIPRGAVIKMAAEFDNSKDNPNNPNNPPKLMTWGEQTTNEMCIAFLGYTTDGEVR